MLALQRTCVIQRYGKTVGQRVFEVDEKTGGALAFKQALRPETAVESEYYLLRGLSSFGGLLLAGLSFGRSCCFWRSCCCFCWSCCCCCSCFCSSCWSCCCCFCSTCCLLLSSAFF